MPERDPTTGRFISDTAANTRAVRELNAQLSETISRMDSLGQSIPTQQVDQFDEGLLVATAALVGMNAAVQDLVRSQIDAAVSLERQQLSLETISGSVEAATQHYKDLLEVARLPGINISQALQASAQLQAIGLSGAKTAEAIGAIGNALALSGQSAQQLTPIISGFRQLNAEGKILQEDLAIITTRIPSVIPLMRDVFGGTRAEDVRRYYESIGEVNRQTELFSDKLIEMLQTLPQMSDTAGNALENLEDTAQRLQARIGTHLLPSVKSAATGLEDVLQAIENSQGATRSIAVFTSMASTLLGVTSGAAALRGALRLLVPVLPLFTGPWGIAAAAVGALAAGYVGLKVATSNAKDEIVNLNTFIARNTDLIQSNTAAVESGALAEIRASRDKIRAARDAADARVKQLRETAEAQFNELRGIKRSGEAFEELSASLRRTNANLGKAESELGRLNGTLKETNEEADKLEKFEAAVGSLKTAISDLNAKAAEVSIGNQILGQGVDIRTPQSNLIKVADAIISDLDTYNQIAAAARSGDETSLENLIFLQRTLRDASQDYFEALQQGLAEAESPSHADNIRKLADAYEEVFGRVDFLDDFTAAFSNLAEDALRSAEGLEATEAAINELKKLKNVNLETYSPIDATKFRRQLKAASQYLSEYLKVQDAEDKKRAASQRANQRLGEQLDKNATKIFKEQAEERSDAIEDEIRGEIKAREQAADAVEDAAERVTKRLIDNIEEREKAEADARKRQEREKDRARRRREREDEREAERRKRQLQGLAVDLTGVIEQEFNLDFLSEGLQAAFGNPIPFAKKWATGFVAGIKNILDGEQLSPFQEEIQGLQVPQLDQSQLEKALALNLANQARLLESYSEAVLVGTEVWQQLIASETALRAQLEETKTSLIATVADFLPGFGDERTPLYQEIGKGLVDLGLSVDEQMAVINRFADASIQELNALNRTIEASLESDETLNTLARIETNTQETAQHTRLSRVDINSVVALLRQDADAVERLLRASEDTPLQDWLDTRQGIVQLFSAEQIDKYLVGQNRLNELQLKQIKAQDPDFAFVDDLRLLLEAAEVPEKERLQLLKKISEALEKDFTDQSSRNELVASIVEVFGKYNINPTTRDVFTARFAELLPVWQDISISTAAAAEYLKDLRTYLEAAGVPIDQIDEILSQFESAFSDNQITFDEQSRLLLSLNKTLTEFGRSPLDFSAFSESLKSGIPFGGVPDDASVPFGGVPPETDVPIESVPEGTSIPVDALPPGTSIPVDALPPGTSIPVDALPPGTSIPVDALPPGTSIPIDALPPGTSIPVDALPPGTSIPVDALPPGTSIPVDALPPGTSIPIDALPPGINIPFGGVPEGTDIDFAGIPEGTSIPIDPLPEGTSIPIDFSGLSQDNAGNSSRYQEPGGDPDRYPPPVETDGDNQTGLADGSPVPSETESALLAELALLRAIGEEDGQHAVAIKDTLLNGITINNELQVRASADGLDTRVLAVHTPVDLSADAKRAMGLATANTKVTGNVGITGTAQVKGNVGITGTAQVKGDVRISDPVSLAEGTVVRFDPNQTQQVEIANLDQFVTALDNLRNQIQLLGG